VPAPRVAFVVAEFNAAIAGAMQRAAEDEVRRRGASLVTVLKVPGSYEVPLAAERLLGWRSVDALVVLGYIERGETDHGDVMGRVVHGALVDASLRYGKPVGFGFIGPGATLAQAKKRKEEYARAAVRAALRMLEVLAGAVERRRSRR